MTRRGTKYKYEPVNEHNMALLTIKLIQFCQIKTQAFFHRKHLCHSRKMTVVNNKRRAEFHLAVLFLRSW